MRAIRSALAGIFWALLVAGLIAQTPSVVQVALVEQRLVDGRPPVLVVRANGPVAWRVLERNADDPPEMLRVRLYGVSRGQLPETLPTALGALTLVPDGSHLLLMLVPAAPLPGVWAVHLGRGADILEIERR